MIKKKRLIAAFCLLMLSAAYALWGMTALSGYYNILELVFDGERTDVRQAAGSLKMREIESYTVVSRNENVNAAVAEGRSKTVSAYQCDTNYFDIVPMQFKHGSFFYPTDEQTGQAVIDEDLAAVLFSYTDCVGKTILLQATPYTITGVLKRDGQPVSLFGSLEEHAVYYTSPLPEGQRPKSTSLLVRCRESTTALVLSMLSSAHFDERAAVNHDAKARFAVFATKLQLLAVLLIVFAVLLKSGFRQHQKQRHIGWKIRIRSRMFWGKAAVGVLVLIAALFLVSDLRYVADTRMIPSTFANFSTVAKKMREWIWLKNNGYVSGGLLSPKVGTYALSAMIGSAVTLVTGLYSMRCLLRSEEYADLTFDRD